MPAFFRRVFSGKGGPNHTVHDASSAQQNAKLRNYGIRNSFRSPEGRKALRKSVAQDPYREPPILAANAWEELKDLEGGRREHGARDGASVTARTANPFESSSSAGDEGLEAPDTVAVISRKPVASGVLPKKF